jgi:hypothetical protein
MFKRTRESVKPGQPVQAATINGMLQVTNALSGQFGDGLGFDGAGSAVRRQARRRDDVAFLRVLGRDTRAGFDGFWKWEEVGLARRKVPPVVFEWSTTNMKRSSARGHGPLWLEGMQNPPLGPEGLAHLRAVPVLAFKIYIRNTEPFWYARPSAPPVQRPFVGRVQSFAVLSPNRWSYSVREVEYRLVGAAEQWVDTTALVPPGRTVAALNFAEASNSAAGVQGHGVNISGPGFPATFATQPVPAGSIVLVHPVTTVPALAAAEATRYWFERVNGVDGTCPSTGGGG